MVSGNVAITGGSINGTTLGATTASTANVTTLTTSSTVTINGGTVNGVAYLDGSKVLTTGSALTFDGTNLGIGTASPVRTLDVRGFVSASDGTTRTEIVNGGGVGYFGTSTNHPLAFQTNNVEQMRLTSTGLGIGTSSPSVKLDVQVASGTATVKVGNGTVSGGALLNLQGASGAKTWFVGSNYNIAGGLEFTQSTANGGSTIGSTPSMLLDSSGNLGLGVTPSAWNNIFRVMQLGTDGAWVGGRTDGQNQAWLGTNAWWNGSNWIYTAATTAGQFLIKGNEFQFLQAGTGSIGGTATFTQAMTLDASGNLLIGGTTTPSGGKANNFVNLGGSGGFWTKSGGVGYFGTFDNYAMVFATNDTERARITSGGELLVGVTAVTDTPNNGVVLRNYSSSTIGAIGIGHASGVVSGTNYVVFAYNGGSIGSISQNGTTAVAYNTSSDYRLKDNPKPLTGSGAFIDALKPKTWNWKADGTKGVGFIAHEVQEVSPGSVTGEKDGEQMQAMEYGSAEFIANIIAELQSLRARLAAAGL
jgi:hypothetical protein